MRPGRLELVHRWWTGLIVAAIGPSALAAACIPLRGSLTRPNFAVVLVIPVVLAASTGRRLPGVLAALSAGVGFDVFLTRPYYSLTIADRDDFVTLVVLIVVALLVGEISVRTRRAQYLADIRADYLERLERVGELATHSNAAAIARAISSEICDLLPVANCRYESTVGSRRRLPTLEAGGTVLLPSGTWSVTERGFPPDVLEIPTHPPDGGRFVIVPITQVAVHPERLRVALALVDRFRITPSRSTD